MRQFSRKTQGTKGFLESESVPIPASPHQPDDHDVLIGWLLNAKIVSSVDRTVTGGIHSTHKMSAITNSAGLRKAHVDLPCPSRPVPITFRPLKGDLRP